MRKRTRLGEEPPVRGRDPTGSQGTGRPFRSRLEPWEASQNPKVRAAGPAQLRVPAESPCHFLKQLGLPPTCHLLRGRIRRDERGRCPTAGVRKDQELSFFQSPFLNCREDGAGAHV